MYTMEYYSAVRKIKSLNFKMLNIKSLNVLQMDLENIMMSKVK